MSGPPALSMGGRQDLHYILWCLVMDSVATSVATANRALFVLASVVRHPHNSAGYARRGSLLRVDTKRQRIPSDSEEHINVDYIVTQDVSDLATHNPHMIWIPTRCRCIDVESLGRAHRDALLGFPHHLHNRQVQGKVALCNL